jgi:4a-hydroxytetrahydrobiopterin dehydratase
VLPPAELDEALASLPAWEVVDGRLHRQLHFADFAAAFAFMTAVAAEAEQLDHHPDWCNSWNVVTVDIVSHAAGGITARCVALARAVDRSAAP